MTDIWRLLKKHQMFNLLTLSAAVHCCLQTRQVFSFFTLAGSVAFASQIVPQPFQSPWTADGLGKTWARRRNCQQSKVNISGEAKFYDTHIQVLIRWRASKQELRCLPCPRTQLWSPLPTSTSTCTPHPASHKHVKKQAKVKAAAWSPR